MNDDMATRVHAVRSWLVTMAGAAAVLAVVDRLPAAIAGTPHGARIYRTVAEAELAIGARLWIPASVPASVAWPPARIDVWPGPPTTVVIRARGRGDSRERLALAQSIWSPASPPPRLLEPLQELTGFDVPVGRAAGRLTRGLAPGGHLLHDLSWTTGSRRVTVRYDGPVQDLLRMSAAFEEMP